MSIAMNLLDAAQAVSGRLLGKACDFAGVSTDSRVIKGGELFLALSGETYDGHEFVAAAAARGAAAAVVSIESVSTLGALDLPLIVVADTRLALGALAAHWRSRFDLPLIAVTGSNGKTTTKEMIASILRSAFGEAVLATQGNFNNDVGLPLTLFMMNASHRAAIIEMGMNRPGEIAYLSGLARPTVALVTNAQRAHLAGMGTLEAVASEKGSIFDGMFESGIAVINADDEWSALWSGLAAGRRVVRFGFDHPAEVSGRSHLRGLDNNLTLSLNGREWDVTLALPGLHNARNALAAAAATLAAGIASEHIVAGLSAFRGIKGRLQRRDGMHGAIVLDDTYNANPDSVRAGIDVLASTIGRKILVLGDMGEIGEMTGQFHDEIGGYAKSQGVDLLFALGESSAVAAHNFGAGAQHFKKYEDLVTALLPELSPETTVLVKGSRFMRMERVSDAIALSAAGSEGGKQ